MRRRAGDMRDTARLQPRDVIGERLMGIGQHQRTAGEDGTEKDLQAAIAADVVERCPDRCRSARWAFGDDRAGQRFQRMAGDLWHPRGARGEHQPFGAARGLGRRGGLRRQLRGDDQRHAGRRPEFGLVGDDGIDPGIRDQGVEMRRVEVRRTQQHAAGDAVELDHGKAGPELVRQLEQHGTARELVQPPAQNSVRQDARQRYDIMRIGDGAAFQLRAQMVAKCKDLTRGHFRRPARNRPPWRGTLRPRKW
ncbi:hypothetical protein ABIA06_003917 [Bradyrhizobium yuanmingense]